MPRRAYPSPSLAAAVRSHFALTQAELARFVGISRQHLAAVEAGRKNLSDAPRYRLWVLTRLLPPPNGQGPPAPVFVPDPDPAAPDLPRELPEAPDTRLLQRRVKRLRFYLAKARFELSQRGELAQGHARRRWALAVLRTGLSTPPADPSPWLGATPDPAADLYWLGRLELRTTLAPVPLTATEHTLRLARLRGLEAELAALEGTPGPAPLGEGSQPE